MTQQDAAEDSGASDAGDATPSASATDEAAGKRNRKERVLHTRIPAVLEDELKAAAEALRVPVSNLVRTILEDAVAIADRATGHVEERLNRAARSVHDERERMKARVQRSDRLTDVIAYQPVIVAQATECASCDAALARGDDAALGLTQRPGPKLFVCKPCLTKLNAV